MKLKVRLKKHLCIKILFAYKAPSLGKKTRILKTDLKLLVADFAEEDNNK